MFLTKVSFSSDIHVIAPVTDKWKATVNCPCYDRSVDFNIDLGLPSSLTANEIPTNATIAMTVKVTQADGSVVDVYTSKCRLFFTFYI